MVQFYINADTRRVALILENLPREYRSALLSRITAITDRLYAEVLAAEPHKTGKLRSETRKRVVDGEDYIRGQVFVSAEFAKAAALEYGAHKVTQVRSHTVRRDTVFGKYVGGFSQVVAAHSRHLNIAERRYLRGPFAADEEEITNELRQALDATTETANQA